MVWKSNIISRAIQINWYLDINFNNSNMHYVPTIENKTNVVPNLKHTKHVYLIFIVYRKTRRINTSPVVYLIRTTQQVDATFTYGNY